MSNKRRKRIRRIAVALGAEGSDAAVLESIARLAAETAAELSGVFVEDVDLFRLAQLPFAREISLLTSSERRLESRQLERQLRAQAAAAERVLASTAERAGVTWSFRVRRGPTVSQLLEATLEADLIVLGGAGREPLRHTHLRVTARAPARMPREVRPAPGPIAVAFDRSAASKRALDVAARLARATEQPLLVLVAGANRQSAERQRERATGLLGEEQPLVFYRTLVAPDMEDILNTVRRERAGMLVLGTDKEMLAPERIKKLRQELDCPALLVR